MEVTECKGKDNCNRKRQKQVLRLRLTTPATKTCRWGPRQRFAQDDKSVGDERLQKQEQKQILRLRYASLRKTNLIESKKSQALRKTNLD